jgi:hypothetical protein
MRIMLRKGRTYAVEHGRAMQKHDVAGLPSKLADLLTGGGARRVYAQRHGPTAKKHSSYVRLDGISGNPT